MTRGASVGIIAPAPQDDRLQDGDGAEGHFAGVASGVNVLAAGRGEALAEWGIAKDLVKALREVFGIFRAVEQAALGFGQDFWKGAMVGLDDGHASGQGFEDEEAFWLVVSGRNGEHVDRGKKIEFAAAIDLAQTVERSVEAGLSKAIEDFCHVGAVFFAQPAGDAEAGVLHAGHGAEVDESIGEKVEALLRR